MKKITFSLLLMLFAGFAQAQSYDKKLLKVYDVNELTTIQQAQPERILVLNYALDNACYFANAEGKDYSSLPTINLESTTKVPSFIDLGLKIENQNQYFRVQGTDQLLVVKSEIVLSYERKNTSKK